MTSSNNIYIKHLTQTAFNNDHGEILEHLFLAADSKFKQEINSDGKIFRISNQINFSSEALFTSLMQIGLPPNIAIKLPFEIIPFLKNNLLTEPDKIPSTSDIRIAVVQSLHALETERAITRETISMWSAAYIRRYGNPLNQFVKVLDNGIECDLNYDYIRHKILPHLLTRIIDLPSAINPFDQYSNIFSTPVQSIMSQEIISAVNTLNLYSIRYKTLINLLQDLVLEPPHPWMVNKETIEKIVEYNIDRTQHHISRITEAHKNNQFLLVRQASEECARHAAAAILSRYGAFLGVGCRYGLVQLKRMLNIKLTNTQLWNFCNFHDIECDLRALGYNVDALGACIERLIFNFSPNYDKNRVDSIRKNTLMLAEIAKSITNQHVDKLTKIHSPNIKSISVLISCSRVLSKNAKLELIEYIKEFLEYPGEIFESSAVHTTSRQLCVMLSRYQANQISWGFKRSILSSHEIIDVNISEDACLETKEKNKSTSKFDVFLCHNSADKEEVKKIGLWLRSQNIIPWLDEWELRPGFSWQQEIEKIMDDISCVAVFVGASGVGPWQSQETEFFIRKFVEKKCPVIPVILRSAEAQPKLPTFLHGMTWVDFRKKRPNQYHQLYFGITGIHPSSQKF